MWPSGCVLGDLCQQVSIFSQGCLTLLKPHLVIVDSRREETGGHGTMLSKSVGLGCSVSVFPSNYTCDTLFNVRLFLS